MSITASIPELRPFQKKAKSDLWANIREGCPSQIYQSATGSGKGTLAANVTMSASTSGRSVLFLVNRRPIVNDFSGRLDKLGVDHGVIMADHPRRKPWLNVHVASIDTLYRRDKLPKADLIFVDECRFSVSDIWVNTLARYEGVPVIGMDATPVRLDGRGLGEIYKRMVKGPSVQELTEMGYLAPARVFAPAPPPDMKGVKSNGGDWNNKQAAAIFDRPKLTGDVVKHWLKFGENRPTICFSVNVEHSKHTVEAFLAAGIPAEHVDADTKDTKKNPERDRIWERARTGETKIICSVEVVSYGFDLPFLSCAIMNAPTQSLARWLQRLGRVLRTYPGKTDAIILDHAGGTIEHGFAEDDRDWTLEGVTRKKKSDREEGTGVRYCAKCWRAFSSLLSVCPEPGCGFVYSKTREVRVAEGELSEMKREAKLKSVQEWRASSDEPARRKKYEELLDMQNQRGYKPGFAAVKFKTMYGQWPSKAWKQTEAVNA